jgi:short-subunit dehydrogenase
MNNDERALITGASSGIGEAFARKLAALGDDLVLVARSAGKLHALAAELTAKHSVRIDVVPADLLYPDAVDGIVAELAARGIAIGTLVNNAGIGSYGEFATLDAARESDEIFVNVHALVMLTRALLPAMLERGRGAIVNVASVAGFQPIPYMATYSATKAFVLSFSEALAEEVRARGVRIVALSPGQTATAFLTGGMEETPLIGRARTSDQVVATALRALQRGRVVAVDGFANYLLSNVSRFSPRWLTARITARMYRPAVGTLSPSA